MEPRIVALHLCTKSRAPLQSVERVNALEETGLEGDRHAKHGSRPQVRLIEQEHLAALKLQPGDVREQATVLGIALDQLGFGARLKVGRAGLDIRRRRPPSERVE